MTIFLHILFIILILPAVTYLVSLCCMHRKKLGDQQYLQNRVTELSIILPCHNESKNVERKINELYRECKELEDFEIIIIDDGSTDTTRAKVERLIKKKQVRAFFLNERKGKPNALNLGVSKANFEILLFADARQSIQYGAVAHLIQHLRYSYIGAVSAQLNNGHAKSIIRTIINYLKKWESKTDSTVGVYGALYAIRKSCYKNIPDDTILDDLLIPLHVILQNKKVKFEERAVVFDMEIEKFYSKKRTLRIVQGLIQLIRKHYDLILLLPRNIKIYLFCQKYYKLLFPFILALAFLDFSTMVNAKLLFIFIIFGTYILILTSRIKELILLVSLSISLIIRFFKLHKTNIKWEKF